MYYSTYLYINVSVVNYKYNEYVRLMLIVSVIVNFCIYLFKIFHLLTEGDKKHIIYPTTKLTRSKIHKYMRTYTHK